MWNYLQIAQNPAQDVAYYIIQLGTLQRHETKSSGCQQRIIIVRISISTAYYTIADHFKNKSVVRMCIGVFVCILRKLCNHKFSQIV